MKFSESRRFRPALALGLSLALAACASPATIKVGETRSEVEARFPPKAKVAMPGGVERWQYPSSPAGTTAYMVDFGPDGRVQSVTQALTADYFFKNLKPGLTKQETLALLGAPGIESWYPRLQQDVWSWRYWDQGESAPSRQLDVFFGMSDGRLIYFTMTPDRAFDPGAGGERIF
ncbi:MAG: hypothetical protein N2544_05365 [Burkholderiales bacterium]|nr:hypothetical protein [Burkholderiales bacterium]